VAPELIVPDWPAPGGVRALVSTRALGDMKDALGRQRLRALLPGEPVWLRQVHGTGVVDAAAAPAGTSADASYAREKGIVCTVMAADCMPVLLAEERGEVVGIAHAGWRGLCAGVVEATCAAMSVPPSRILAWLGPAIGPDAYEVGEEVHSAFLGRDSRAEAAFRPTRPGHWHLDLYAIARQRLAALGVERVFGGGFCTASEPARFFSYRRDKASERMAAAIWIQSPPP
jgi:polyphenol oxidase